MSTSLRNGKSTSRKRNVEVEGITPSGVWLRLGDCEYFLDYDIYPWFKRAIVDDILRVELLGPQHLHWPELDVDLELDCLKSPEKYPLVYR